MKKLVVAGMLGLAACTGLSGVAVSGPLFGSGGAFGTLNTQNAPVVKVQANDTYRVQQLEEQIRQLNGRIEEMSFQLLQMQETIRKAQEDNEFRFQELEGGKSAAPAPKKKAEAEIPSAGPQDDVATIIETPSQGGASMGGSAQGTDRMATAPRANAAPGESTLGSIELDSRGMPVGGSLNPNVNNSAGKLPGVDTGRSSTTDPVNTAALTSENDIYQAAYSHVLSGDYKAAEKGFEQYIQGYPKGAKAADANFWLGEAQYSQGKFTDSAKTFLNAHQTYSKSPKAPEMLLKLGMSLAALDNKETACATLREVPKRYPSASKTVLGKVTSEQKRLSCQ
ncbi:tol-pal system protein YbgF [Agrobacterium rubi]|uniref:tol-pal system protein YbgF n=1 Tax=Agrobacterium rubi TaxID=28099 RepID=UPI0015743328|nr:tol-pal system protein YbgF [Agrobacterium rubi]NTF08312.1 tol-pal system protein YbgF [Agrobacterium rubi]NTF20540.1 tol-pal system protein YbgF [Agrobacterium rubi]NTF27511.1 tol-pal system protein YbgF [Agrobacterium rubi]